MAALALLTSCSKKAEEEAEKQAPAPVQVTEVKRESIHRIVETDAVLFPLRQHDLMPKIAAPVRTYYANRGDHVREGQLLAALENRDLLATVAANQGQLAQAEANLRTIAGATVPESVVKAQADVQSAQQQMDAALALLNSRQDLFQQGALAGRLVDEARVQYANAKAQLQTAQEHLRALQSVGKQEQIKQAQAQVEAARGQLRTAEAQVNYTEIRSPITGVVADRPLYPGDMASTGQPLFVIMDISQVVARANVPVTESSAIRVGDAATVRAVDSDIAVPGKVTVVSPATDPAATTVQVWVQAGNPGERLKPGASVRAAMVVATIPNATVVPEQAIVPSEEGGDAVVTVAGNTAHLRPVKAGAREKGMVQIVSGILPGEQVVTVGAIGLEENAKVRIVAAGRKQNEEADRSSGGERKTRKGEDGQ